jgi:hypothetical protein
MLREGRLKRIKSYISPSNGNQSAGILNKFCCELVDEVERLRSALRSLANANVGTSDPRVMASHAADALKEPDLEMVTAQATELRRMVEEQQRTISAISKIPSEEPCPHCGELHGPTCPWVAAAEDYDQRGRP